MKMQKLMTCIANAEEYGCEATMCVYSLWFGVSDVAYQGHLASFFMSSHRLPQIPAQFTNISSNLLQ